MISGYAEKQMKQRKQAKQAQDRSYFIQIQKSIQTKRGK